VISPSQGRYLNTGEHKHRINAYTHQTSMPWMGFEPTIPESERAKTIHALDHEATVTGRGNRILCEKKKTTPIGLCMLSVFAVSETDPVEFFLKFGRNFTSLRIDVPRHIFNYPRFTWYCSEAFFIMVQHLMLHMNSDPGGFIGQMT
jgi:hypothetical protein